MKRFALLLSTLLVCICLLPACQTVPPSGTRAASETAKTNPNLHTIDLPNDEAEFPPGQGREIFMARCTVCHTLRYVTMQPDFPEKTWQKEVDKMRKTWGAHVTESEGKEIVAYLVLIKGKKK